MSEEGSFVEVTEKGLLTRLIESIKGIATGALLFCVAFPLLFWNEGRAVDALRSLEEGAGAVVSVAADEVDPANEGKLVHLSGELATDDTLTDPDFGVTAHAIELARTVEMYQWAEEKERTKEKKLGGTEKTTTRYTYSKKWKSGVIDSSQFKKPEGHENPASMPFQSQQYRADEVRLGGFVLASGLVAQIGGAQKLPVDEALAAKLPAAMKDQVQVHHKGYYAGKDPASPAVGDVRVRFQVVRPAAASVIAQQNDDTLIAYQTKAGDPIAMLSMGTHSADSMFARAESAASTLTWILRVVGLIMMFIGLCMVFAPIAVFGDVIPLVGSVLGAGFAFVAGILAFSLSFLTIAIAWIYYRPLIGIPLLLLSVGGIVGLVMLNRKRAANGSTPAPESLSQAAA